MQEPLRVNNYFIVTTFFLLVGIVKLRHVSGLVKLRHVVISKVDCNLNWSAIKRLRFTQHWSLKSFFSTHSSKQLKHDH